MILWGINVMTTLLASGLAMVGPIRDYCDETNAIFCENTIESFVLAVNILTFNTQRIAEMKRSAHDKALTLTIDKVDEWFNSLNSCNPKNN